MGFYDGKIYNNESIYKKTIKLIFIFIVLILTSHCIAFFVKIYYLDLPNVYVSASTDKVVAVISADGEELPLNPLPKKYIKKYKK